MTYGIAQSLMSISQLQVSQQMNMSALRANMDFSQERAERIAEMAEDRASIENRVAQDPALGQQINLMA